MKAFTHFSKLLILFLGAITFTSSVWGAFHSFDRINPNNTRNIQGNYAIAGNTVMCLTETTSTYGGTCQDAGYASITSNMRMSQYIDIDSDTRTWNSTSSYITVPSSFDFDASNPQNTKKGILWAGLFWQGRINGDDDYPKRFAQENGTSYTFTDTGSGAGASYILPAETAINTLGTDKIKLKVDTGNYTDINASSVYTYSSSGGITYAAFSDVTNAVKTAISTDGNHTFTVANLTTCEGREGSPGVFGGWSIVVIYAEDYSGEMRNISVFSGFDSVGSTDPSFTISDFILPKTNTVNATLSLFSGEGEYLYATDWVKLSDDDSNFDYMPGAIHPNNIFDGVFSGITRADIAGESNNLQINNDGVDIDSYDVSNLMTTYRDSNPDINTMYIKWYSNSDYITPSMLVFATQIYAPKLCYDYSLRQDGNYLEKDTSTPFPVINSYVSSSNIDISIYLKNMEADIPAKGVSMRSDVNATEFTQTGHTWSSNTNGSLLIDRGTPTLTTPLCDYNISMDNATTNNGCTDGHNIRKGLGGLDAQDYVYNKFTLQPNVSGVTDINESLRLTLDYYIEVNGATIEYKDYELGSPNVPICTQSFSYKPTWGQFNVIRSGQTSTTNTNNIYTQISRNPFNASVIFDSDTNTGVNEAPPVGSDVNTTLMVEIIDMDAYGDINASCANPDSSLTTPIFVTTNFTNSDWMTNLTAQNSSYYNFAVKNAAYRVWYFADGNNTLIENWTATTDTNNTNVTGISGLYNSVAHPVCNTDCSPDTTQACFNCIRNNYAKPLCSRDNFSVRPESYDLRIYDIDQNNTVSDPSNIDLSTLNSFDPSSAAATDRIDLAAAYNYRYDINATGNDGINRVPGYTRYFVGGTDYNVTMYWDPQNGEVCEDTNNVNISFYVGNGTMQDEKREHTQVGEYKLNIIDTSWTAVDWSNDGHHTVVDGFDNVGGIITDDCQNNSTSTTALSARYGCTISTNHPSASGGTYQDHDVTYHPYAFNTTNTVTLGKGNISAAATGFKPFVYMNNLSQDENMSVHLNTTVTAIGKNSTTALSNYVTGCYSKKPLNFSIGKTTTTNNSLTYNYMVHNKDSNLSIISAHDQPLQTIAAGNVDQNATFSTTSQFFQQDQNGTIQLSTNLNYGRDVNVTTNPEDINFTTIFVDNNSTLFNADLVANKFADGNVSVNQRVLHYYGKTIAPKIRVVCNTNACRTGMDASNNNNIPELINYVVFCEGATCNSSILPLGATQIGDIRWFSNKNHDRIDNTSVWLTPGTDGTIGTISEVTSSGYMSEVIPRLILTQNHEVEAYILHGAALPLPYDAIMQMQSSPWLINHETDNNATTNEFVIQFVGDGGWSGKHEDNTTTKTNFSPTTNRRIMW